MAKPPPISYGGLKLAPRPEPVVVEPVPQTQDSIPDGRRRPMESKAEPTLIYLHPDGKMALKRWALDSGGLGTKVHDLLIEALEEWAEKRGLKTTFRVPTDRKRRLR